jgi:nickel transport protein
MRGRGALAALALAGGALVPAAAAGHELLHSVERGGAIAVRAWYPDGRPLAGCAFEVFSPADPAAPHHSGRTDPGGHAAFVPDAPGTWRVRIRDASAHGVSVPVEVAAGPAAAAEPPRRSAAALALRPAAGAAAIALAFAALFAWYRRR